MSQENEILASEYALGTLDAEQRAKAQSLIETDAEFAELVSKWEMRLSPLSDGAKPVEPPQSTWDNIQKRLGQNNTALPRGVLAVTKSQGHWYKHSSKVEVKSLFIDEQEGSESYLLKFEPGGVVEEHAHGDWNDECIVLEGHLDVGDVSFGPGDFHVAIKGAVHPRLASKTGAVLFVRSRRITGIAA